MKLENVLRDEIAAGRVVFPGMLDSSMKWSALAAAECFVLPSFSEGLSMSVLEAMGAGVPVLITYACHMPEVTAAGAGWEIEAATEPLTGALHHMLTLNSQENDAIGRQGARLIAERYSPARVAEQMGSLYRFALDGRRPGNLQIGNIQVFDEAGQ